MLAALLLVLQTAPSATAAAPQAQVDRDEVRMGETFTLTLSVDDQILPDDPDLEPLRENFEILGTRQSSRHTVTGGERRSITEWQVELVPREEGALTIPALRVADGRTEPISIRVRSAPEPNTAQRGQEPVFVEAELERDSVRVQQQLLLTVRIFQAVQLNDMSITEPSFDHATVRKTSQTRYQRKVGPTTYRVHELVYAIFPQRAGELTVPELVFTARQQGGRRSLFDLDPGSPVRQLTPQFDVQVKPIPADMDTGNWLPASDLSLKESWHEESEELRVGESITRTVELVVAGQPAAQIPELQLVEPEGVRLYTDRPQRSDEDSAEGVQGTVRYEMAVVPSRAGRVTLPPIKVRWWNVTTGQPEVAELPGRTLRVGGAPADPADTPVSPLPTPTPGTPAAPLWPWQLATALLAALWLGTVLLWWRSGRTPAAPKAGSETAAWRALRRACRDGDPQRTRAALLRWAERRWPGQHCSSLDDIARLCGHNALRAALEELQQHLYGTQTSASWHGGKRLLEILRLVRSEASDTGAGSASRTLPPLNPGA